MELTIHFNSISLHNYIVSQLNTYGINGGFSTSKDFLEHCYRSAMLMTNQTVVLSTIPEYPLVIGTSKAAYRSTINLIDYKKNKLLRPNSSI